jgi:hypothetical protein
VPIQVLQYSPEGRQVHPVITISLHFSHPIVPESAVKDAEDNTDTDPEYIVARVDPMPEHCKWKWISTQVSSTKK